MTWPENVLDVMQPRFTAALPAYEQVRRPVRIEDPVQTLGLFVVDWNPTPDSYEISAAEPTLGRYIYRVQLMVRSAREEEARTLYAQDTKVLRVVLYRDPDLLIPLQALSEEVLSVTERFKKMRVEGQRYMNNEVSGKYICLSSTTVLVETETAPT